MNFEKKNNIYRAAMIIIVTAIITFIVTSVLLYNFYFKTEDGLTKALATTEAETLEQKVQLIKKYLDEFYLGEINEDDMTESAIKGYVAGLGDEYTEYLTKDEYEELMVDVNGNYVGIGIYMTQDKYRECSSIVTNRRFTSRRSRNKNRRYYYKSKWRRCKRY